MLRFLFREKANRLASVAGIVISLAVVIIAVLLIWSALQEQRSCQYEREISLIGRLVSLGGLSDETFQRLLSESRPEDFEAALNLLKPYGYTEAPPESYGSTYKNFRSKIVTIISLSSISLVLLWVSLLSLIAKKQSDFLKETSLRLDALMSGRYDGKSIFDGEGDTAILSAQLNALSRRLEKTMESVDFERDRMRAFISFISHELKTPLASLKTMNELMIDGKNMEREQIEEFLSRSGEDIERMEWLIGDVLNIARIESGAIRFKFRKADLTELARDVMRSYIEIARGKKVEIWLNTESSAMVFCDEKWISQAIGNLLKNAIDYSPEGGSVSVSISRSEAYAYLSVSDEGPGIPREDSSKIFQSFYRGSSAGRSKKGSGLGLSLAKAIIERHQGDIKLKSSTERGSTFTIELPVRREE